MLSLTPTGCKTWRSRRLRKELIGSRSELGRAAKLKGVRGWVKEKFVGEGECPKTGSPQGILRLSPKRSSYKLDSMIKQVIAMVVMSILGPNSSALHPKEKVALSAKAIQNWSFTAPDILNWNDLVGAGRTTVWIQLPEHVSMIVSFNWAVRPDAEIKYSGGVLVQDGQLTPLDAKLSFDRKTVTGLFTIRGNAFSLKAPQVEIVKKESEIKALIDTTPLRFGKTPPNWLSDKR